QEKYADAEPILRESLAILQQKQPEDWETFHVQSLLGGALSGQRKYAEAESHLVLGYERMKKAQKSQGERHVRSKPGPILSEGLERLVRFYDAWGKPEEAAKWRKELETQKEQDPTIKDHESEYKPN